LGVVGCWGARADGELCGHIYSSGLGVLGQEVEQPVTVQTLDEIVILIFSGIPGLSFDETLPHFHFYGTNLHESRGSKVGMIRHLRISRPQTRQLVNAPTSFMRVTGT